MVEWIGELNEWFIFCNKMHKIISMFSKPWCSCSCLPIDNQFTKPTWRPYICNFTGITNVFLKKIDIVKMILIG
jgi:hypothetical protein